MAFAAVAVAASLTAFAVVLEIALRFLPTCDGLLQLPVNVASPVPRFSPNRDFVASKGAAFWLVTRHHTNGAGFVNDQEYDTAGKDPLLAVIGDSYIEAAQVEYSQSVHGVLARHAVGHGRVYSFGASGSQLPTYLEFASHARSRFRPAGMVFVIVGNDFDESLWRNGGQPGLTYFDGSATGHAMSVRRVDYTPSLLKTIARRSALIRYLSLNLELNWQAVEAAFTPQKPGQRFVGNTSSDVSPERVAQSRRVIDEFFRLLPEKSALPPERLLFVLDGMRPALYSKSALAEARHSYFALMRDHFASTARQLGYPILDLQASFEKHYSEHRERFEFERDGHWNALGHRLAAEELVRTPFWRDVFGLTN